LYSSTLISYRMKEFRRFRHKWTFYSVFFTAHAQNSHISASDLRTFSVVFIGKATSPPYFYFRFIWPTDLESVPRVEPPTLIISIKFEVDTTTHRRVTAFLVRIRHLTLRPWPLTFWPWTAVKHGWSRGQPLHQVCRSYAYPFLTYELWCPP